MRSPFGVAVGVPRGSGPRVKGGVYWECPSEQVKVYDPPEPVDPASLGLATLGVRLWENGGCTNVLDWVGGNAYPSADEFVREVCEHGLSRRLSNIHKLGVLSHRSRIYIVALVARVPSFIVSAPLVGLTVVRSREVQGVIERRTHVPVRWSTL